MIDLFHCLNIGIIQSKKELNKKILNIILIFFLVFSVLEQFFQFYVILCIHSIINK